eukprot:4003853-Alexandrium_andersonii.AAC.1
MGFGKEVRAAQRTSQTSWVSADAALGGAACCCACGRGRHARRGCARMERRGLAGVAARRGGFSQSLVESDHQPDPRVLSQGQIGGNKWVVALPA